MAFSLYSPIPCRKRKVVLQTLPFVVEGPNGLLPFCGWAVDDAVLHHWIIAGEYHHLTHDGHVELAPAQLRHIGSHGCVVMRGELQ